MLASPRGLVPALKYDSHVVCDSMVCLEYIEEAFPECGSSYMPTAPEKRAMARYWSLFANEKIIPHYYKMLMRSTVQEQDQAKEDVLSEFNVLQIA